MMEQPHTPQRELLKAAERLEMARFLISKERTSMLVRIHSVLTPDQSAGASMPLRSGTKPSGIARS